MPGQIVHIEIPADDTAKAQKFWGSLFGWQFEAFPGPSEYHMTQISDQTGGAITNMESGKRGARAYFHAGAREERGGEGGGARRRGRPWAGSRPARTRTGTIWGSARRIRRLPPRRG